MYRKSAILVSQGVIFNFLYACTVLVLEPSGEQFLANLLFSHYLYSFGVVTFW